MNEAIFITGVNAITALGNDFAALSSNLESGVSPSTADEFPVHRLDPPLPCFRIDGYDPKEALGKKGLRTKDWATKLLLGTVEGAFKERIEQTEEEERPGICIGTAFGSVESIGDFLCDSIENGVNAVNPQAFANTVINAPTSQINARHTIRSLSTTVSTGFNAGLDALVYSANFLRRGYLSQIICGGMEEISFYALAGMQQAGILSPSGRIHPLGTEADGTVAGEGCAVCMVETESSAREHAATPLARIAGYASTFDSDIASGEAMAAAMNGALTAAGLEASQIAFVAASANGSPVMDKAEARATGRLFPETPIVAYKSKIGECYGASGALAVACALADVSRGNLTPAGGYQPLSGCNLVLEPTPVSAGCRVMINAFSCDGHCTSLVLETAH